MSSNIVCTACRGIKIVKGLGSINKNCDACNGVGYVSIDMPKEKPKDKKLQDAKNGKQTTF